MSSEPKRIGILGGTFDPVHLGHIHIARAAYSEYALDEVWFMPAGDPYFKEERGFSPARVRFEMTKRCLEALGEGAFICSDYELGDVSATYTSETLKGLKGDYPGYIFYFIMGYDSLKDLPMWHDPGTILCSAVLLTALRDDASEEDIEDAAEGLRKLYSAADIRIIHTRELPVSSTDIRGKISRGEDVSGLITAETAAFIKEHVLYKAAD